MVGKFFGVFFMAEIPQMSRIGAGLSLRGRVIGVCQFFDLIQVG